MCHMLIKAAGNHRGKTVNPCPTRIQGGSKEGQALGSFLLEAGSAQTPGTSHQLESPGHLQL